MRAIRIAILILYVIGISTSIGMYLFGYSFEMIVDNFLTSQRAIAGILLSLFVVRNYLLVPPTILMLICGAVFDSFWFAIVVSVIGQMIGLAETFRIGFVMKHDNPKSLGYKTVKPLLSTARKYGFWFMMFGCMFPFFPTDVICYTMGYIRYQFRKYMVAGFIGILPLTFLYTWFGEQIVPIIEKMSIYGRILIVLIGVVYAGWYYRRSSAIED